MKYTKFFSGLVNTQGSPTLEPDQFKQLMNLIHFEGQLAGIDRVINKFKSIDGPHRYDILKVTVQSKIDEVSHGLSPEELLQSWSK